MQWRRIVLTIVWGTVILAGFVALARYSVTAGARGDVPDQWPDDGLSRAAPWELVVFLHPRCPCSLATVRQLARLEPQASKSFAIRTVFWEPLHATPEFRRGVNLDAARSLTRGEVVHDSGGHIAERFGAVTSGHVVLYDQEGRLRFSGGVTLVRAHEGTAPGWTALARLLRGEADTIEEAPVFGCPLFDPKPCEGCEE